VKFVEEIPSYAYAWKERPEEEVLSEADWSAFYVALVALPEPNEALKSGFRWYKQNKS
jgi:hypothetical protein